MSADVAANLAALRGRVAAACEVAGRPPGDVALVAVSKRQSLEAIAAAAAAGQKLFGENRVQEAEGKIARLGDHLEWHLIGPLQSNKVKAAVDLFATIHSVDRVKIARLLSAEAARQGKQLRLFVQVHLGDEESKHGFAPERFADEVRPLASLPAVEIVGLMGLPPYCEDPQDVRPYFRQLRELRDLAAGWPEWSAFKGWLSMGMSHDFEVAIAEGATHVRVGTALFGERS